MTLYAQWEKLPEDRTSVTVTAGKGGSAGTVDGVKTAKSGDIVKIKATADDGYDFDKWEVISGNIQIKDESSSETSFEVKGVDEAIKVKAAFVKKDKPEPDTYSVTVKTDGNGEASASAKSGKTGDKINLSAKADKGWKFVKWNVVSGDIALEDPENEDTSFVIRDSDVVIKAVFEKEKHKLDFGDDDDDVPNEPSKPAETNPDTVEGYFMVGGQIVPNVLMGKMKQGEAAQALFDRTRALGEGSFGSQCDKGD